MLKKIIQTIVRWLKMTFNFNVGGLTPQDALPGGGGGSTTVVEGLCAKIPRVYAYGWTLKLTPVPAFMMRQ